MKEIKPESERRRSARLATQMKNKPSPPKSRVRRKAKTEFLALNDDCIDAICEWLPLKSLAALGNTSKRLNQVASTYFRRKHPVKNLLMMNYNGEVNMYPKKLYVQCFSDNFRNIVLHGNDLNVFKYAATKFNGIKLKRVSINAAHMTNAHTKCIRGILEHAEIVEFVRCTFAGGLNETLKHCSNMKHLAIKSITECIKYGRSNEWLLDEYPTLKHLHWSIPGPLPPELAVFFTQNPNVDSFCGDTRILSFMLEHNVRINELILKMAPTFEEVFSQLAKVVEQNAVQTINVMGDLRYLDRIRDAEFVFKRINGIYQTLLDHTNILNLLPHMRLVNTWITSKNQATELAKQMINLEEAFLDVKNIDLIIPFIRLAPKLTKIYIGNTTAIQDIKKLNLVVLNKQRRKLAGASDVTVYVKEQIYLKIKYMSAGSVRNLVQIKPIDAFVPKSVFVYTFLDN